MPKKRETPPAVSEYLREIGRAGGQKKVPKGFAALSPEARKKLAKKAVKTRWKNARKKAKP